MINREPFCIIEQYLQFPHNLGNRASLGKSRFTLPFGGEEIFVLANVKEERDIRICVNMQDGPINYSINN